MDIVHATITFEDTFSHAIDLKHATVSKHTFDSMQKDIGKTIQFFNKKQQISHTLKIIKIEQSKQ